MRYRPGRNLIWTLLAMLIVALCLFTRWPFWVKTSAVITTANPVYTLDELVPQLQDSRTRFLFKTVSCRLGPVSSPAHV